MSVENKIRELLEGKQSKSPGLNAQDVIATMHGGPGQGSGRGKQFAKHVRTTLDKHMTDEDNDYSGIKDPHKLTAKLIGDLHTHTQKHMGGKLSDSEAHRVVTSLAFPTRLPQWHEMKKHVMGEAVMPVTTKKDSSISAKISGDSTSPRQGDSEDADYEEREESQDNQGSIAARPIKGAPRPTNRGAGDAPNYTTVGDPRTVVGQASSKGNVQREEYDEDGDDYLEEGETYTYNDKPATAAQKQETDTSIANAKAVQKKSGSLQDRRKAAEMEMESVNYLEEQDLRAELDSIFGEDLSEDFRSKAASIFEAAVIARVNSAMEDILDQLQEQKEEEFAELKEALVEKVDAYLSYVVEQWMNENELVVEQGLRTEISEDFMRGLQRLFTEHYIEVPEEKYDVVEHLQQKTEELTDDLNNVLGENVSLKQEITNLKKSVIIAEMSEGLADTEFFKLKTLVEGVGYDSDDLYREKLRVIRENYFPRSPKYSPEEQILNEAAPEGHVGGAMQQYVQALSKASKKL